MIDQELAHRPAQTIEGGGIPRGVGAPDQMGTASGAGCIVAGHP